MQAFGVAAAYATGLHPSSQFGNPAKTLVDELVLDAHHQLYEPIHKHLRVLRGPNSTQAAGMKKSMGRLRDIAVTVRGTAAGDFEWILLENAPTDGWMEIDSSTSPSNTYKQAMADGLLALQALIADVELGPREVAEEISEPKRKQSHGFFGFGPV